MFSADQPATTPATDDDGVFASTVLAMTEDVWREVFSAEGSRYEDPKMVLFSGATESGCGFASAQMVPSTVPGIRRFTSI